MTRDMITVLDTTLRDGEQSAGINLNRQDKVDIARMLEQLKVDVIEAGFAASSESDFEAIKAVAREIKDSTVCSLSRAVERDIDLTAEAVRGARSGRIHIVLSTSPVHMRYKLQQAPEAVLEQGVHAVKHARRYSDDIEFSCEDASRSESEFLARIVEAIIAAGVTTVSLPDTVGYAMPPEYGSLIGRLIAQVPNSDKATFSAHCHNDLQVECTINGIGERAGNASLEEIVMAIRTRHDHLEVRTGLETRYLVPASRLVSERTGFVVQPNKAIVGRNAFAHESGIHQDGMLKNPLTYQIMAPETVGGQDYQLVLGKHSGRAGYRARMERLGVRFSSEDALSEAFRRFKKLCDQKLHLDDKDLLATAKKEEEPHVA
ncbi:MAG: 2-isopropylmalate synthase [Deltaproteobacteria bacterium]|nr:MAG: 2-isopropylmalate synthase [Deltaproteobacteria bacterium]